MKILRSLQQILWFALLAGTALAQTACGGGLACQIGTGLVVGAAIGGAQVATAGKDLVELGISGIFNDTSFLSNARGMFTQVSTPLRTPDRIHQGVNRAGQAIISKYWNEAPFAEIRQANHWGTMQGSIYGIRDAGSNFLSDPTGFQMTQMLTGSINWSDMVSNYQLVFPFMY